MQLQENPPTLFSQIELDGQVSVPAAHSSTSSQVSPSPENPVLHSQSKPPTLLEQAALASQLSVCFLHSFTSAHVFPFPVKPAKPLNRDPHRQANEPTLFSHS